MNVGGRLRRAFGAAVLSGLLAWWPGPAAHAEDAAAPNQEISFWYEIQGSRDPADFKAYLQQFPNGTFSELAANRIATLDPESPRIELAPVTPLSPAVMDRQALSLLDFAFWDTMKGSKNPDDLKAYLRKFPKGAFRDRVRQRLQTLQGEWIPPNYPAPN